MKRDFIKDLLSKGSPGREAAVCGWVRTRRDSKAGLSFIELNDGSCLANLQIVAGSDLPNYQDGVLKLYPGAAIKAVGPIVESPGSGQKYELKAASIEVFGLCDPVEYPLQKQRVSFERLRELAHLRPRTNTFGAMLRVRNELALATHRFFQSRGFLLLHTPIITASDCEGAGETFQVTCLDPEKPPRDAAGKLDWKADFFGRRSFLTVSGQLEGEACACAMGSVYTFGPTFRAENSNTRRHLAEFWMIEPEMAFADLNDDAQLAEDYLKSLLSSVLANCQEDLKFFDARVEPGLLARLETLANASFASASYTDAVKTLKDSGKTFEFPVDWGLALQSEHERFLTEEVFKGPLIVTGYPKEIKPFYMRSNADGRTVAAMDVLVPGVGEIIGGSQREERLEVLVSRMEEMRLDPASYWWYMDLRKFGSIPHAGFGLGFERMVQFCTGLANIRDAIPFPRTPGNAEF